MEASSSLEQRRCHKNKVEDLESRKKEEAWEFLGSKCTRRRRETDSKAVDVFRPPNVDLSRKLPSGRGRVRGSLMGISFRLTYEMMDWVVR